MFAPGSALPVYRIDRRPRTAAELAPGDYVHDDLAPFVVASFENSPSHVVAVVGRLHSGTDMRVRYLASRPLDVSRPVRANPPAPTVRPAPTARRHLSLVPPVGGTR